MCSPGAGFERLVGVPEDCNFSAAGAKCLNEVVSYVDTVHAVHHFIAVENRPPNASGSYLAQ